MEFTNRRKRRIPMDRSYPAAVPQKQTTPAGTGPFTYYQPGGPSSGTYLQPAGVSLYLRP